MHNTIMFYEGKYGTSKKTAEVIAYILGNTKTYTIKEAPKTLDNYENVIFVFGFYGYETAQIIKTFVKNVKDQLRSKKIGIIGIGISKIDFQKQLNEIGILLERTEDISEFVEGELRLNKLSQEDYNVIKMFLKKAGMPVKDYGNFKIENVVAVADKFVQIMKMASPRMPDNLLKEEIRKFIINHNTCALATGKGEFVRCTPLEYLYDNDNFYIITEGGLKFKGILQNDAVCIGIADNYENMGSVKGLQISGVAKILKLFTEEYLNIFKLKKIQLSALEKIPVNLYVIKVIPEKFEFLNAEFKKNNFASKQELLC